MPCRLLSPCSAAVPGSVAWPMYHRFLERHQSQASVRYRPISGARHWCLHRDRQEHTLSYEAWLISTTAWCCLDSQEQAGPHPAGQDTEKLVLGIPKGQSIERQGNRSTITFFLTEEAHDKVLQESVLHGKWCLLCFICLHVLQNECVCSGLRLLLIPWRLFTQLLCHGLDFMCLFNMNSWVLSVSGPGCSRENTSPCLWDRVF